MNTKFAFSILLLAATITLSFTSVDASANSYSEKSGPYKVMTVLHDWMDSTRSRNVPVKIYYPSDCNTACPVIIFSHGLGGSREGYEYLGRYWANWGCISVHLQHKGSDTEVFAKGDAKRAMVKAAADPRNAIDRPKDVSFAIDQLEKLNKTDGPLNGHCDLNRIGVAGHSFGAYTTLAVAGQVVGRRLFEKSFTDPRVKAAIPMSAPVPKRQSLKRAYGKITIPCMHMTGTKDDDSSIGETAAADRRLPFDNIVTVDQYLIIFNGGDHMIFSGRPNRPQGLSQSDAHFQSLIKVSTTAFWDAYLRGDQNAKSWLKSGGLKNLMGTDGTVEQK